MKSLDLVRLASWVCSSSEEARQFVDAVCIRQKGDSFASARVVNEAREDYAKHANEEIVKLAMIERLRAQNIEEIHGRS